MADAPKINPNESLRESYPKLNQSIDNANKARTDAAGALAKSLSAEQISLLAEAMAQNTQKQLDNVIIESGTSDAETIQARGDFPILNDRLNSVDQNMAQNKKHSINGDRFISLSAYNRLIPENNDLGRINRAISETPYGGSLFTSGVSALELPSTITINKKINIFGGGVELRPVMEGLDVLLKYDNVSDFIVEGLNFNQNLIGRTSMEIVDCYNFTLENLFFTGYSKEFGYYHTDGGVRISNSKKGKFINCRWKDHGGQYNNETGDLNRCITIEAGSDYISVIGCDFDNVNQLLVSDSAHIIFTDNTCNEIKDNYLYLLNSLSSIITNNIMTNGVDECIVVYGKNILIDNNIIEGILNKFIAINGNTHNLTITNNVFDNTNAVGGKFISWRDYSFLVNRLTCTGNAFLHPTSEHTVEFFEIGSVDNLIFTENNINIKTNAYQRMLYFVGEIANGLIKDNEFIGTVESSVTLEVSPSVTEGILLFENNRMIATRGVYNVDRIRVVNQNIDTSIGPYIYSRNVRQTAYSSVAPTNGKWNQGDVVWNNGHDYNVLCWRRANTGSSHVIGTDWIEFRV